LRESTIAISLKNVAPDTYIFFLLSLFIFEVLMLSLQNHLNYYFNFEFAERMLYAYSNLLFTHSAQQQNQHRSLVPNLIG
jgi:hypothetical protein